MQSAQRATRSETDAEAWKRKLVKRPLPGKGNCVFAVEPIKAGELMGYYEGEAIETDTMYSIRLDGQIVSGDDCILRYMAHDCEPNAWFRDKTRWLYAMTDIAPGDEVTIDYLYTEPVISAPFTCHCGSSKCRGEIKTPEPAAE